MKRSISVLATSGVFAVVSIFAEPVARAADVFTLTSSVVQDNGTLATKNACSDKQRSPNCVGENISPPLAFCRGRTQQALGQVRRRQEHDGAGDIFRPGHAAECRLAPLYVDHNRHRSRPEGGAAGYDTRGIGRCPQGSCKGLGRPDHPLPPPDIGRALAALNASADVQRHP
jgi:hypothetical protein